jgi:hypothetical protein
LATEIATWPFSVDTVSSVNMAFGGHRNYYVTTSTDVVFRTPLEHLTVIQVAQKFFVTLDMRFRHHYEAQ